MAGALAIGAVTALPAAAGTPGPVIQRPAGAVTADGLPTVQIDGVAWKQVVQGNNVFVGGRFTNARPAGAAVGTNQTPRNNLLSFDINTGVLNSSFAPSLDGQIKAMALSPDGSKLYVGGSFLHADNGVDRKGLAVYDTATGALTSFAPSLNSTVTGIAVTGSTVYVSGWFSTANEQPRARMAAFSASSGSLLAWAPTSDADINDMVMSPDKTRVIVGGKFANLNGSPAYGMGALDATTGALLPWDINTVVRNAGENAGIFSLSADSSTVYGTQFNFGTGNFEGVFAANNDGTIKWLDDCHGDTYAAFQMNNVVYGAGHAHQCENIGGFPDTNPRVHHAVMAYTAEATGTVAANTQGGSGYGNFDGQPAPSIINWFPTLQAGDFTGKTQAVWSLTGNGSYLVAGGEFPTVNNVKQQGLVRFAVPAKAPNKVGPQVYGSDFPPTLTPLSATSVRVAWASNWDMDDQVLKYDIYRSDKPSTPIGTVTATSQFWKRPTLVFKDDTVQGGKTYSYRVKASDPSGNSMLSAYVNVTMPTASAVSPYVDKVRQDGAADYWRMGDSTGTLVDYIGTNDLVKSTGVSRDATGALASDTSGSTAFDGTSAGTAGGSSREVGPDTFSAEAWIKTTSTSGGKIIGFGDSQTGISGNYDRHVYMDTAGHLTFGVYPGGVRTVTSDGSYNDGSWHHVVASLSGDGMKLYVDGQLSGSDPGTTSGQPYQGYWRVGGDNLNGWPTPLNSHFFAGSIDEVAIYPTALTAAQVSDHYAAASAAANNPPTAAFTQTCTNGVCSFDAATSSDSDGTVASYAWTFGDGDTATGVAPKHTYQTAGTFSVKLSVTDNQGATTSIVKSVSVTLPPANQPPTAAFTSSCAERVCAFDASGSTDSDGVVSSYRWDFGDNTAAGSGAKPGHTYTSDGTYTVVLTVTDDKGATTSVTKQVVAKANQKPTAAFTSSCSGLTCSFDGGGSTDADGSVAGYAWNFGDSKTGTGPSPSHTFDQGGTFPVTLTVTDDKGATDSVTRNVTVVPAANQAPKASFTTSGNGLAVDLDGTGSTDSDGSVASYAWDYGDGATGTGATPSHTYAGTGAYAVKLTVKDNQGLSASVTKTVLVAPSAVAVDQFGRTSATKWGTADVGGAWTHTGALGFATDGSVGSVKLGSANASSNAYLNSVSQRDVNLVTDISVDTPGTGNGTSAMFMVRRAGTSDYRMRLRFLPNGVVRVQVAKLVGGSETVIKDVPVSGLTYQPGDVLKARFQAVGSSTTTLTGTVWKAGTAEPGTATVSGTDATAALQAAGTLGFQSYLGSTVSSVPVTTSLDNLVVTAG